MGDLVEFPRKKHKSFSVKAKDYVFVLPVSDIEDLASGKSSIAEYGDPEKLAQAMALIIMDFIDVSGR